MALEKDEKTLAVRFWEVRACSLCLSAQRLT